MGSAIQYLVFVIAIFISILFIYMKYSLSYWRKRNVPYLEPTLFTGNFKNPFTNSRPIFSYFLEFYKQFRKFGEKYGGIYVSVAPIFLVLHPQYVKCVLVKNFWNFQDRGFYYNERDQPISINIVNTDGENWKNLRLKFTPAFTIAKNKSIVNIMTICSEVMGKYIDEHSINKIPLNARDCASRFAVDVFANCALGIESNSFKDNGLRKLLVHIVQKTTSSIKFSFRNTFPKIARLFRMPFYPSKEADFLSTLIRKNIEYRIENNITRSDFLQLLVEMKRENVISMTEIVAQSIVFILAGYETSACALTFILFELANNQNIQDKLRYEIRKVLNEYNGQVSYDSIMSMEYLEMIVCETLRKYPPVPLITRKCVQDFVLPDTNVTIEKGTNIIVPVIGLHHDSEYFPNPDKFDPERFSKENKKYIIPYTYLPFADGPRNCIGARFAMQEIKIGIINIIRKYRIKLNARVKLPMEFESVFIITPKKDILLDIEAISEQFVSSYECT